MTSLNLPCPGTLSLCYQQLPYYHNAPVFSRLCLMRSAIQLHLATTYLYQTYPIYILLYHSKVLTYHSTRTKTRTRTRTSFGVEYGILYPDLLATLPILPYLYLAYFAYRSDLSKLEIPILLLSATQHLFSPPLPPNKVTLPSSSVFPPTTPTKVLSKHLM